MEKVIEIPDNPTNGDMIMLLFNPYKIGILYGGIIHVYLTEVDYWNCEYVMSCSKGWWNAPYKDGEE